MGTVRFKGAKPTTLVNKEYGELKVYGYGRKEVAGANVMVSSDIPVDPILANNSWETIRTVCEEGNAANYWALGDSKTVTTNSLEREWRIADMGGLYNKHVVFAMWNRSETTKAWDAGNVNAYADADVITDLAVGGDYYIEFVDAELGAELTDTTVSFAENGNSTTLATISQKLFLPAEKELTATRVYSVQAEFDALRTFTYFAQNDNNDFRVRRKASTPHDIGMWWTRSPHYGYDDKVVRVGGDGTIDDNFAQNATRGVCPCFSF